ncbi:MAG: FAD-dependent oxidoreductase [Flavonifractor plautii]
MLGGRTGWGHLNQCVHGGWPGAVPKTSPGRVCQRARESPVCRGGPDDQAMVTGLTRDRTLGSYPTGLLTCQAGRWCWPLAAGSVPGHRIPSSRQSVYGGDSPESYEHQNLLVGRRVVVLGSGDTCLIMARRMTLEGQVLCVAEQRPAPGRLAQRAPVPGRLWHPCFSGAVTGSLAGPAGRVVLCQVDEQGRLCPGTERRVDCDTLLLSVGLIPENEVGAQAGIALDPVTNGAVTDPFLQTSVPGIFACGNSRRVMDLADFVTVQGRPPGPTPPSLSGRAPGHAPGGGQRHGQGPAPAGVTTCILCQGLSGDLACRRAPGKRLPQGGRLCPPGGRGPRRCSPPPWGRMGS